MTREHSIGIAGPTYLDRTLRVDGVLSLDGSRQIVDDYTTPGGTGLSYAIALARQGSQAELFSAIGTDNEARLIINSVINEPNLDASWQHMPGSTDHAVIFIDGGNHKCVASRKEQSELWQPDTAFIEGNAEKDALVFTSFANRLVLDALTKMTRSGKTKPFVMWAPHHGNAAKAAELLPVIDQIDHITLSEEEYSALFQSIGDPTALGVDSVTVTSGKNGVTLLQRNAEDEKHEPIVRIDSPLDTNGAGEAFGSGYLTAYLRTGDRTRAVLTGSFLGALHVERPGSDFPKVDIPKLLAATAMYDNDTYRRYLHAKIQSQTR